MDKPVAYLHPPCEVHSENLVYSAEEMERDGVSTDGYTPLYATKTPPEKLAEMNDSLITDNNYLRNRVKELNAELELERMRLAACGVVAMANTPESAAKAREMRPEYRSASCDDVAAAVDREMALRVNVESQVKLIAQLREVLKEVTFDTWATGFSALDYDSDEPEENELRGRVLALLPDHTLWKTGEPGVPDAILDSNGEVVLGLCKVCGRGECELVEPCVPRVLK